MTFLFYLLLDLFDPVSGAAYCSSPAFYHGISLLIIDLRAENTFHITAFQYCLLAFPESHSKTCKICGTKSSCLNTFRTFYSHITDIGLDLQEKIVCTCSAVYTKNCKVTSCIFLHNLQHIIDLICK